MVGARRSCGRGDWRSVGSRSWRTRRAAAVSTCVVQITNGTRGSPTLPQLGLVGVLRPVGSSSNPPHARGVKVGLRQRLALLGITVMAVVMAMARRGRLGGDDLGIGRAEAGEVSAAGEGIRGPTSTPERGADADGRGHWVVSAPGSEASWNSGDSGRGEEQGRILWLFASSQCWKKRRNSGSRNFDHDAGAASPRQKRDPPFLELARKWVKPGWLEIPILTTDKYQAHQTRV